MEWRQARHGTEDKAHLDSRGDGGAADAWAVAARRVRSNRGDDDREDRSAVDLLELGGKGLR